MRLIPLLLLMLCGSLRLSGQSKNDLWVVAGADGWSLQHPVQKSETLFSISRKYHVPPAILAEANGLTYKDGLKEGSTINVPLGAYNMQSVRPANGSETRPLYYKVRPEDNLYRISRQANVSQRTLLDWNGLPENKVRTGQALLVGWVLYDATPFVAVPGVAPPLAGRTDPRTPTVNPTKPASAPRPAANVPKVTYDTPKYIMSAATRPDTTPVRADTATAPVRPATGTLEAEYLLETDEGRNVTTERGAAAFYALTSGTKGAAAYAFHNSAARGAVIRVKNINNGRYVFVKVLGPLPETKQYHGAIIGLSNAAKAALGVRDEKAFCELTYGGY